MSACPETLVAFAHGLADIAASMLREAALADAVVRTKPDGTPVTEFDQAIETALRRRIEAAFPAHGIIGEEFAATRPDAEWVWIIDPLDGTREFIQGLPLFGTLLAVAWHGRFVLGLAEQPLTGDRWIGIDGQGASRNGRPVRVRACPDLGGAVVSTMGYDSFCPAHHATLSRVREAARSVVIADSFYVFGLLAAGRVDLIASDGFALHDYAALDVIVREAGGCMSDWSGRPLTLAADGSVLAAGDRQVWQAVLPMLRDPPPWPRPPGVLHLPRDGGPGR